MFWSIGFWKYCIHSESSIIMSLRLIAPNLVWFGFCPSFTWGPSTSLPSSSSLISSGSSSPSLIQRFSSSTQVCMIETQVGGSYSRVPPLWCKQRHLFFSIPIDLSTLLRIDLCALLNFISCALDGFGNGVIKIGELAYRESPKRNPCDGSWKLNAFFILSIKT